MSTKDKLKWVAFILLMFLFLFLAVTESVDLNKEKPRGEMRVDK